MRATWLQLLPILVLVTAFLAIPLAVAFWGSFNGLAFDFSRYATIFTDPVYISILVRSLQIAAVTTFLCIALGYPVAYFMTTLSRQKVALFAIFLLVPMFTAFLIRTYAWMIILGRRGVINTALISLGIIDRPLTIMGTSWAVYIGMVHVLLPIAILIMYANMAQLDRSLTKAAGVLGAQPVRAFFRIYLPMSTPAIISATMLIFIITMGFYIAPVLLGGPANTMISQMVVTQITTSFDFQMGYALTVCLLLITIFVLFIANIFVPIEQVWSLQDSRKVPDGTHKQGDGLKRAPGLFARIGFTLENLLFQLVKRPAWLPKLLRNSFITLIVLFLLAPLAIVYLLSFSSSAFQVFPPPGFSLQWYQKFFTDPAWLSALWQSAKLALVVASIAAIIGVAGAFALVRGDLPVKRLLFLFILLPLLLPLIILALGLYLAVDKIGLSGSFPGLVIGHLLIAAPYAIVILAGAVRNLDRNIEYAAATLGARPGLAFRKVVFPILAPSLVSAWLMSFLTSFDELLITLFLLGRQDPTLPIKMWSDIRVQVDPTMNAASSVIVTTIIIAVVSSQLLSLSGRRRGRQ